MTKKNKPESFDDFLKENLIYADYVNLAEHLNESPHFTTKMKNSPEIGTVGHLKTIVDLIRKTNPDIGSKLIIELWGFGKEAMSPVEVELSRRI